MQGGRSEWFVHLLPIIQPLHVPEDGGWGSARGGAKHFQACYYFISSAATCEQHKSELHVDCSTDHIKAGNRAVELHVWDKQREWLAIGQNVNYAMVFWLLDGWCGTLTVSLCRVRSWLGACNGHARTQCKPEHHAARVCPSRAQCLS